MKLEVRNYIRKNKENMEKGKSLSNFSSISTNDFYNYLKEVISIFENKTYIVKQIYVIDEKDNRKILQTVLYNKEIISDYHFNNIKRKDTLSYVISEQKNSEDMLILPSKTDISLLTDKMDVNLPWKLLHHFPYLNEIVLDLINYKYECELENKSMNYECLIGNIIPNYHELITLNLNQRKSEKEKEIHENNIISSEINRIVSFIETSALDESKKKILIYEVKKLRK